MQYIDTQSGEYPLTLADLRSAHPLTIFFEPFGGDDRYMPVAPVAPPEHDTPTQKAVELEPTHEGGQWRQAWCVVPLTPEEQEQQAIDAAAALEAARASKNVQINAARLAANFSTFTHAGTLIACDPLSRSDIDGTNGFVALYGALPPGWPGGWKAMDNSYVAIADVAAWKAFYASMFAAGNANFAHAQALKALLAQADTPEAVAAIQWGMDLP
ncbi:MAG: DUF4376 domain-containing protein [Burkholderiaceae bacterium]|nr:DUF4376 domain-containing protein [Burkholderiaceae bacterium]